MVKYNLTFWQKIELIPLWFYWKLSLNENKKTWHEVKKGMEKHVHKYTIPIELEYNGKKYKALQCDHEACNMVDPID